ncbi:MAG: SIS domain-containing protein [Verrucomicrobiae bacterium]|nr:SIS domain-containing protein [Verrucomicrobiae bacterium]
MSSFLEPFLSESLAVQSSLGPLLPAIQTLGDRLVSTLQSGGKLLTCGNGGSAADAQHMTEELVGRYNKNRRSLPGIALTADSQALTCIANDYGYDAVFSRQIEGLGSKGDLLVVFSTSGQSPSIVKALQAGRSAGLLTAALLGKDGGTCRGLSDLEIIIPSQNTARIQEAHTFILHCVLEIVDRVYVP